MPYHDVAFIKPKCSCGSEYRKFPYVKKDGARLKRTAGELVWVNVPNETKPSKSLVVICPKCDGLKEWPREK